MATLTYEEYQKRVHENLKKKRSQSNASRKAAAPEGSKEYFDRMRKVEEGSKEYFDLMRKAPVVDSVRNRMTVAPLDDFDAPIDPKWLNKGLFEDGYDFGDVSKTILGTAADVVEDLGAGIAEVPERIADAAAMALPYFAESQLDRAAYATMNPTLLDNAKKYDRKEETKKVDEWVAKDLYDGKAVAHSILNPVTDAASAMIGQDFEKVSVLGEKADSTVQSGGQLLATMGLQAVGVPWFVTTGAAAFGAESENALNQGATHEEAMGSAAISAAAEILTEKISGGIKFGGKAADEALTQMISRGITNKLGRSLAKLGLDAGGEAFEELLSEAAGNLGSALYRLDEESWQEIMLSEEAAQQYIDAMIGGGLLGGVFSGGNAVKSAARGVDYASGLTKNEKAVVDALYKERVEEARKNGEKVKKSDVYNDILDQMDKGYIATEDIERILGGDTYTVYKDTPDNDANKQKFGDALSKRVSDMVRGDRLAESYAERGRRGKAFDADLTQYDEKTRATYKRAVESGVLNNTRRSHELVDFVAKIEADKGVKFDFTNNQKLKESGFAVDGVSVNGYVIADGVVLNTQSSKYLQSVAGYEITHVLEGTEFYDAMKEAVFTYAKTKGEYDSRLKALTKLYENVKDANIEAELTADLVGDYIFSDADFVKSLATGNRNVFQKIYDEIKYLCRSVTARSKEARQLEKVRKVFADAYRQDVKNTAGDGGVRYSLGDIKYPRTTVGYKDINARRAAEDSLAESLVERQKVTQVSIEDIPQEYAKTDWADSQKSRLCIKEILKQFLGEDVVFNLGDNSAIAYLTSRGVNHAASGANTESKAASFAKFYEIVSNAEYCYSCPKDTHSKTSGREDWDYFVSVAKMGEETIPLVFAVRSIDQDVRSQIYSIATKTDSTISHGDGTQGNPANAHPNYGDSSSPNKIIPQDGSMSSEADKKADFSLSSASAKPFDNGVALEAPRITETQVNQETPSAATEPGVSTSQEDIGPVKHDPPVRNTKVKVQNQKRNPGSWIMEHIFDHGFTFEKLAKASKDRELEAKWHNVRNYKSAAQNMIGKGVPSKGINGINQMRQSVTDAGVSDFFADYLGVRSVADKYNQSSDLNQLIKAAQYSTIARNFEVKHPEVKLYGDQYFAYTNHLRTMLAESGLSEAEVAKLFNELHSNAVIGDGSFEALARVTEKVFRTVYRNDFGVELRKALGFPANTGNDIAPLPTTARPTESAFPAPVKDVDEQVKQYIQDMMDQGQRLFDESIGPIQDALFEAGKEGVFHEYMYHKLNVDRSTMDVRFGKDNVNVFPGVSAKTSEETVRRIESQNPEFAEYAERIYDFEAEQTRLLVEHGLMTQEQADRNAEYYPHYVPIRRTGFIYDAVPVLMGPSAIFGESPVYKLKGSDKPILPLFDTLLGRTIQTQAAITERSLGVSETEINSETGDFAEATPEIDPMAMEDVIDRMFSEKELLKAGTGGINPTMAVFENGERIEFDITDQMYDALKPRSSEKGRGRKLVEKALKTPSSTFRKLVTEWNPTFWFTNPIKDFQDVLVNSQHAAKTYASVPKAVAEIVHKGKYYQEYMEHVGNRETYFDMEKGKFVEEKPVAGAIQWPFKKIAAINNAVELTPRMAEYIASREEGRSIEVSILDAARVTTNFGAGGDVTKAVDSYFAPFLNASVQGAVQQVRNAVEASQQGFMGWLKLASRVVLAGVTKEIPDLVNSLIWGDDDDYEELSQYIKDNYYVFKIGDGKFFRIPKGRISAAIQYAAQQMENAMTGDDVADFETFAKYVIDNIGPNNPVTNNLIAPIVQVAKNEAWYGEQLVPDRLLKVPEDQQFDETTDEFSLKLYGLLREYNDDEDIGISPYQINYLLNQYGGGAADMLLPPITPKAEQGDDSILGNLLAPLKDKFTTDSVLKNQNVSDFYETEEALELLAADKNATMADKAKAAYMSEVGYDTAELYRKKREIQMSDLPAKEKYERARDIQKRINAMMENALDSYEDVYTKGIYAEIDGRRFNWSEEEGRMYEVTPLKADGTENWYYANEQKAVGRFGISYEEFWNNRDAYCEVNHYLDKRAEWNAGQERLYKVVDTVFGAKEFGQYATALNGFFADKDEQGNAISGTKKKKVVDYINGLNVPDAQKYILYKMEYPDNKDYNQEIFNYVEGQRHLSLGEKKAVLEALGMKVDDQGYVTW